MQQTEDERAKRQHRSSVLSRLFILGVGLFFIGYFLFQGATCFVKEPVNKELGQEVKADNYSITPVSVYLVSNAGSWRDEKSSDTRTAAEMAASSFGEGLGSGLAQGLTGSRGDKDKDAFIVVHLWITSNHERPHVADDLPITVTDERGEKYYLLRSASSVGHKPLQPGGTYRERLVFPAYSNSKVISLEIGSATYRVPVHEVMTVDPLSTKK